MPPTVGTDSGMEVVIAIEYLAMRLDCLIELLQDCLGVTGDGDDILAKDNDTDDLLSSSGDSVILPLADGAGDSNATWIVEGGNLAG
jgi:hypothetical protein